MEKEAGVFKRLRIVKGELVEVTDGREVADVVLSVKEPKDKGMGAAGGLANIPACSIGDWGLLLRSVAHKEGGGSSLRLGVTDRLGREECCFYVDADSRRKREIVSLLMRMIEEVSHSAGEGGFVKGLAERCRLRL